MYTYYIGLGSNLGDRYNNLQSAIAILSERTSLEQLSSVYESEPQYESNQGKFLNMVCKIRTAITAPELLKLCKNAELDLGRRVTYRNGPRIIDLDILYSDSQDFFDDQLQLPHPGLAERAFVLAPWAEIEPDLFIPLHKATVKEMLQRLDENLRLKTSRLEQRST